MKQMYKFVAVITFIAVLVQIFQRQQQVKGRSQESTVSH